MGRRGCLHHQADVRDDQFLPEECAVGDRESYIDDKVVLNDIFTGVTGLVQMIKC